MELYGAIVVGGGVMGAAAAYQLARRGVRTLLLEQFRVGHTRGSSHGASRIIRYAYDDPAYVRLARRVYPLWEELSQEAGEPLVHPSGGLDLGPRDSPVLERIGQSLGAEGVPYQELDGRAVAARFPQFRLPGDWRGLYQRDAGILPAGRIVELLVSRAAHHGAEIQQGVRVERIHLGGARLRVEAGASFQARRLVVAAGAWAGGLLAPTGVELPLRPTGMQVCYLRPADPAPFRPGALPIFICWGDPLAGEERVFYGLPLFGGKGVKLGEHSGGRDIDPEGREEPDPEVRGRVLAFAARLLPALADQLEAEETCRYTMTPDEHFLIDRHPLDPRVVMAAGFSGHGFKFAPLVGQALAGLCQDEEPDPDFQLFGLGQRSAPPGARRPGRHQPGQR